MSAFPFGLLDILYLGNYYASYLLFEIELDSVVVYFSSSLNLLCIYVTVN